MKKFRLGKAKSGLTSEKQRDALARRLQKAERDFSRRTLKKV